MDNVFSLFFGDCQVSSTMKMFARLKEIARTEYGRAVIDFTIITLLAGIIFRNFLFSRGWPAGGDVLGWISREYIFGKEFRWIYMWRPYSFGFVEGINSMDFLLALIYSTCSDPAITIKIFMFFSFLLAGFSMYAFAYHYTHKHSASLAASLTYTLNQWSFSQFTEAHIDITFSYAFAPLLFLLLARALETRKAKDALALTLAFSVLVTGFHPECLVIYGVFIPLFVILHVLSLMKSKDFGAGIRHLLKMSLPVVGITFFLSAFLLVPFIANVRAPYYSPAYKYPLEDAMTWSYKSAIDAFTLTGIESWGYVFAVDIPEGLSLPFFPTSLLLLGLFFLSYCTILLKRDKYTIFFVVSTLVSFFISLGPNPPLGSLFIWAWFNVPHFAVFRAASRWVMMIAFSHAFFVSILVKALIDYIKKRRELKTSEVYLEAKIHRGHKANRLLRARISFDIVNDFVQKLHKFLHAFSIIILILVFLSGFIASWFFFSQGLQEYTPPQIYLEAYEWIAEQPGDFRIVSVGKSTAEWQSMPNAESDFSSSGMLTDVGWGHDLGHDSSFIHDKPTLQNGGWEFISRSFVDHLRFQLVRNQMTDALLKILGTFNYRYVVLPPYITAGLRDFFLNQEGSHVVYDQNSSIILENEFYTPRMFSTADHALVIGGQDSFQSLSKIDAFSLNSTALIFAHQTDGFPLENDLFSGSEALVFVNSDILDLVMLSLKQHTITAADYGAASLNYTRYWVTSPHGRTVGRLVLGGDALTTRGNNSLSIPFRVESDGLYDFWLRVAFAPGRGELSVFIDNVLEDEIRPLSDFWSRLQWIKITSRDMKAGDYVITLWNDGTGYNDIDSIAVVKASTFQTQMDEVINTMASFNGRLIYVMEAESAFTHDVTSGWSSTPRQYNDFVLRNEGRGRNVAPLGNASASSVEGDTTKAQGANDGSISTRWASSKGLPQWLQIEWTTSQELSEVRIFFEHAYAQDYVIQSWNGVGWTTELDIRGNTLLQPVHQFQQPIETTKLRIYVTSAPDFDMVSIWELEAYSPRTVSVSTEIAIPREGNYKLAARLGSGPEYGSLHIRMNNITTSINCSNLDVGFKWHELEPIFLKTGEQMISISSTGKVDVDEIILYSLEAEESAIPVNQLFKSNSTSPHISYEKVDPVQYRVHVEASEPFLLIFSDSYNPLWKAYVDNVELSPVTAYSFVNGFFINKTGSFDVTLYFTGQTYADLGLRISMITLVVIVAILATPSKVFERLRNCIRQHIRA